MKPLVLASTSRYKSRILEQLGVTFQCCAPKFDELACDGVSPAQCALDFACAKARSVRKSWPGHVIIGADQTLEFEGEILGKPGSIKNAVAQLQRLSGRTHQLHTAFALLDTDSGREMERLVTSNLRMRSDLDHHYLEDMVRSDQSHDCCGGYKWESKGVFLFEQIETSDPNAIVGLPLIALATGLRDWGYFGDRFTQISNEH